MLNPLSSDKEAAIPVELIRCLREGRVLALVGSGFSIPLGYPSWNELIRQLLSGVDSSVWRRDDQSYECLVGKAVSQPEWVVEIIRSQQPESYFRSMRAAFEPRGHTSASLAHALLALLGFKGFLTTNYDTSIEDYVSIFDGQSPRVLDYNEAGGDLSFLTSGSQRFVLKLHGCIRRQIEDLVLSSTDYYGLMHDARFTRMIASLLQQFPILSMGFSLQDKNLRRFLEERRHLYANNCPPMYAVVGERETCKMEIAAYRELYNVQVVTVSEAADFEELTAVLLSLFCLVHRVDSSFAGAEICDIARYRLRQAGIRQAQAPPELSTSVNQAWRLLSVFEDPVPLELFTTLCTDCGLGLSPAHYRALACADNRGRLAARTTPDPTAEERTFVARWLRQHIEAVPISSGPRYLSTYHKGSLDRFRNTICSMLMRQECWQELIGDDDSAIPLFHRLMEYFRQEGLWSQWLEIIENALAFVPRASLLHIEMVRSKLWVLFWTRRYSEAQVLLASHPDADNRSGESSYKERIKYMSLDSLTSLVNELEKKPKLDRYSLSLLGRSYARIALRSKDAKKKRLLERAKTNLQKALTLSGAEHDLIETSVQSWYLACVHAELGEKEDAMRRLSEVRRLDECIMGRVPGIAWLRVAEYRLEMGDPESDESTRMRKRQAAIEAMSNLGVVSADEYVDKDYFY